MSYTKICLCLMLRKIPHYKLWCYNHSTTFLLYNKIHCLPCIARSPSHEPVNYKHDLGYTYKLMYSTLISCWPVSYTHLDVYKRQVILNMVVRNVQIENIFILCTLTVIINYWNTEGILCIVNIIMFFSTNTFSLTFNS